jgi:hypothetical protein
MKLPYIVGGLSATDTMGILRQRKAEVILLNA